MKKYVYFSTEYLCIFRLHTDIIIVDWLKIIYVLEIYREKMSFHQNWKVLLDLLFRRRSTAIQWLLTVGAPPSVEK